MPPGDRYIVSGIEGPSSFLLEPLLYPQYRPHFSIFENFAIWTRRDTHHRPRHCTPQVYQPVAVHQTEKRLSGKAPPNDESALPPYLKGTITRARPRNASETQDFIALARRHYNTLFSTHDCILNQQGKASPDSTNLIGGPPPI